MLTPSELKRLHPKRRLVPYFPPSPAVLTDIAQGEEEQGSADGAEESTASQITSRYVYLIFVVSRSTVCRPEQGSCTP